MRFDNCRISRIGWPYRKWHPHRSESAIGTAGSDVALESADVVLMADNLDHLPLTIELSRATRHIIHQNLWMSLAMVAYLVSATIFGLNIGPAVALHEGSTLVGVTGYCT